MKRSVTILLAVSVAIAGSIGCAKSEARELPVNPVAPKEDSTLIRAEARADVKLVSRDHTGETWRGKTVLPHGDTWVTVDEEVTLDARGHLVHAFTRVREDGGLAESTWIERATDTVTIERGEDVRRFHPPTDRAWTYAAVSSHGAHIATPLCAWAAYRATEGAEMVRLVEGGTSTVLPADQLVVDTENGSTVAMGDEGVDVDARFIRTLHLKNLTFAREAGGDGTYSFSAMRSKTNTSSGG